MNQSATIYRKPRHKPEVLMMVYQKGWFRPADRYTASRLRERDYRDGDLIGCQFKKLNNPKFHRLIHYLGVLCAVHIEEFHGMDAHTVLKRLQWEANVHCEVMGVVAEDGSRAEIRFPLSWAFDSMDDGERHAAALGICRYVARRYWPDMEPEAIMEMAEVMVNEG